MDEPNDLTPDASTRILVRARHLLQRGWCQHTYARNAAGQRVGVDDPAARSYCAAGAMERAARGLGLRDGRFAVALRHAAERIGCPASAIPAWNDADGQTQEKVLRAFDNAIGAK